MGSELNIEKTESSVVSRSWIGSILHTVWNWTGGWLSWTRQSDIMLRNAEKKILSYLKTPYKRFFVDIGSVVGQSDKIWTVSLNDESNKTPLVLIHGMGAGLALWVPNLDAFAATRPVYAFDLLGFGRSSRPKFASDAAKVEEQWVESVEEWRREVNIDQFILLGHSLGGYIAKAYALKYPRRVRHLILADPWGFTERPSNVYEKFQVPFWVRAVFTAVQPLNPLWAIRAAGPAGKWLVGKTRPDISRKFIKYVPEAEAVIPEYIYQCNSQTPSGESAFHTLMLGFGWAKNPMLKRVHELDPSLPVSVIFGSRSWVDNSTGQVLADQRQGNTYVHVINGAGHHVYVDKPELYNKYVIETCARADEYPTRDARAVAIASGDTTLTSNDIVTGNIKIDETGAVGNTKNIVSGNIDEDKSGDVGNNTKDVTGNIDEDKSDVGNTSDDNIPSPASTTPTSTS